MKTAHLLLSSVALAGSLAVAGAMPANHATPNSPQTPGPVFQSVSQLPLWFEPNQGQAEGEARFLARGPGYRLLLQPDQVALELGRAPAGAKAPSATLRLKLPGAQPRPHLSGEDKLAGKVNYFRGQDPARWHTGISTYARVKYHAIYPGVDLVFYGQQRQLEFDFVVAPGADPRQIRLAFEGAENIALDGAGNLVLLTDGGGARLLAPQAYQMLGGQRKTIRGGYVLSQSSKDPGGADHPTVGFAVADYDSSQPLIIDPVVEFIGQFRGNGTDDGNGIAVDGNGYIYVVGSTCSTNLPTTANAWQPALAGGAEPCSCASDVFVLKLNPAGTEWVYCTYLGGDTDDLGYAIAVDAGGNAYITGWTISTNFPTRHAFQPYKAGDTNGLPEDVFVAKLSPSGSELLYATYLGGSDYDYSAGIAVDAAGNAYVAGGTASTNFPTRNAFQPLASSLARGGPGYDPWDYEAFVTKIDPTGSALVYSTYLGGSADDGATGLAVDPAGHAYVVGSTRSQDFPVTNAFQAELFDMDAFVAEFAPDGASLVFSTYLGGNSSDGANAVALDPAGNIYVGGSTYSTNFPTRNALQPRRSGNYNEFNYPESDGFVTKLGAGGSELIYSTYVGGSGYNDVTAVAADAAGNAYLATRVRWGYFANPRGGEVFRINADGSSAGGKVISGMNGEPSVIAGLALDRTGDLLLTGAFFFADPPPPYLSGTCKNRTDAFIARLDAAALAASRAPLVLLFAPAAREIVGAAATIQLKASAIDLGGQLDRVEFYQDNQFLGSAANRPFSLAVSNLALGSHILTAAAFDSGGLAATSCPVSITVVSPPANDCFANRLVITGTNVAVTGSNVGATIEAGDPRLYPRFWGWTNSHSVWWSWRAPVDGKFTISTDGSDFFTLLGLFLGSALPDLTWEDEGLFSSANASQITFRATAGTVYQFAVNGDYDTYGQICLKLRPAQPPPNDDFANRIPLAGFSVSTQGSNVEATPEAVEAGLSQPPGGRHSVWWSWTAPTNGTFMISTRGSPIPTGLTVYTGEAITNLVQIPNDTYSGLCILQATAGTTYQIAVDGYDEAGEILLTIAYNPPPPNDNFADRIVLSGLPVTIAGSNLGATREPGEPSPGYSTGSASVWWSWTAPTDGHFAVLGKDGPAYESQISIFTGETLEGLVPIATGSGVVAFKVTAGTLCQIAVDSSSSYYPPGNFTLTLRPAQSPPNDDFADRILLSGLTATDSVSMAEGTRETGEPVHSWPPEAQSVWWTWTAPTNACFIISTEGSELSTAISVFTGSTLSNLMWVASSTDFGYGSKLSFNAAAGANYQIAVAASDWPHWPYSLGDRVRLNLHYAPPPGNDNFAGRICLNGLPANATGSNEGATTEPGEPNYRHYATHTIWWSWTAPTSGPVRITASGIGFSPVLEVFTGNDLASLSRMTNVAYYPADRAIFYATAGTTYQLSVDGASGGVGEVALNIVPAHPPANDDFANRIVLAGPEVLATGSNVDATCEAGEPAAQFSTPNVSVWWSWTAPRSGTTTLSTAGSDFYTTLNVFTGTSLSTLMLVAPANGLYASLPIRWTPESLAGDAITPPQPGRAGWGAQVTFEAVVGTTYQLLVDSSSGREGNIVLSIEMAPRFQLLAGYCDLDGRFHFRLDGPLGLELAIETSTNLVDWTPLATATLTNATVELEDASPAPAPARFYRARTLP